MKEKKVSMLVYRMLSMVLLICLIMGGCSKKQDSVQPSEEEQQESIPEETEHKMGKLKSFEATTLDGSAFTQEDLAKKDVTVINFWSLSCGPCIVEMPDIAEFAQNLPEHVQMITVCLDGGYDIEETKDILSEAGFEGITLISGDGDFLEVCKKIQYTPTTIVADKDGNIIGDAIIGRQKDLEGVYTEAVNEALTAMGEEEIGSEESQ